MDRFIMNTDLPGVIAGRMLSKRALRGTSTGQKMTLLLSSVCRFGEQRTDVQGLLWFVRCVYTVCSSMHYLCDCICVCTGKTDAR